MAKETDELKRKEQEIEPGMIVEATDGDLGTVDVSKPVVTDVVRNEKGDVEALVVEKGAIFKKELQIPVDRVEDVEFESKTSGKDGAAHNGHASSGPHGKIIVDAHESELEALTAFGHEQLPTEYELEEKNKSILDRAEQALPTHEGLREMEAGFTIGDDAPVNGSRAILRQLGPGLLGGLSGNDSSAVTAYAIDGAQNGFSHLWLMLLSTPLYYAVLFTCAKLGRVTQQGFATILKDHYGRWAAMTVSLVLIVCNVALIAADLAAIGTALSLVTNNLIDWRIFAVPAAIVLWYLTVFRNFESLKKIFIVMSLAFITYIITAFLVRPDWGNVLVNTFVPHLDFSFGSISGAVALLGATLSPYTMFWQVQGEKEEKRPGTLQQKLRFAGLDIGVGALGGNLIAYFIIVATAGTLFVHHKDITTAADAAQSLVPIVGPFAKYLFAIGIIGAGLVAIPVLLASTSYAVTGTFGWPAGLSKKPWQNEGFYLILTVALAVSLVMALLGIDPIKLIFWANILSGILAPILVVFLILVGNNRKIMGEQRLGFFLNGWLLLSILILVVGAGLLFYGLATGQGG